MKMLFTAILTAVAVAVAAVELKLAENGRTGYVIVLPDDAIPAEKTGAKELAEHLRKMTGAEFKTVTESAYEGGPMIAVGFNGKLPEKLQPANFPNLGEEELVIAADGDMLLLGGGRPRGALYAVYEFLEQQGIRWYTPTYTHIPQKPTLTAKADNYRYTSVFSSRSHVPGTAVTPEWCARNRMNTFREWRHPGVEYGGGVLQGPDMHTFWRMLNPALFKQHPEWACMIDGVRQTEVANTNWGLCLSQKDLRKYLVDRTMDWVRKRPDYTDIWIGQNDGSPYCTCEECKAFYDAHGGQPSSLIVQLINELADAVGKEFPEKRVKTLAYSWSIVPPTNMELSDRVTMMFCALVPHFTTIGKDPETMRFVEAYRNWQGIAKHFEVYLYGYPIDSSWFPAPCLYNQADNLVWAAKNGFTAAHQELFGVNTGLGGDLADLRVWLYTTMMWHPEADPRALVEDFCRGYYGDAADTVLAAINETHRAIDSGAKLSTKGTSSFLVPGYVDAGVNRKVNAMLEKRYHETADPELKKRVGYAWLPWLWAEYWLHIPGYAEYNARTGMWGARIENRKKMEEYGRLIKKIMIENNVGALRLFVKLNPHTLRLAELTREYPAVKLEDGKLSALVVPGCYGKFVDLTVPGNDFKILKPAWGMEMMQYPRIGYWREFFNGKEIINFNIKSRKKNALELTGATPDCQVTKNFKLENGTLTQSIRATVGKDGEFQIRTVPMFELREYGFNRYPTLMIGQKDGSWESLVLGSIGKMWYQTGTFKLDNFNGTIYLIDTVNQRGLEMTLPPGELGTLSYQYDCGKFEPKSSSDMVELYFGTPKQPYKKGDQVQLTLSLRAMTAGEVAAALAQLKQK